ncbi:lytic transglycosylase domain-containing protein [Rhizobium halophytocola]|uniref:Soluble lytic murein transglycosylase-like protein n=1 Tax=Rhizobium halophytocola TaxID=735519 RepID=A0ABS4E350_9HYPH|nr:transglycosylase SLT domain-containing protein [Rhizobium halophytocola]MBP1852347.1 soluble lytic murein transglycosylase-like protein [Rhizobium halophytocola]
MIRNIFAAAASIATAMSFCGPVHAKDVDDGDVATRLAVQRSAADAALADAEDINPFGLLIKKYANKYDVPVNLAQAVVQIESNFNPKARGSAGEIGLMQIKPATARMMGFHGSAKALYDPETNIRWGMKYLAAAHDLGGGETCQTILKYNAGHGAKRMNPISKRYCGKVMALLDS